MGVPHAGSTQTTSASVASATNDAATVKAAVAPAATHSQPNTAEAGSSSRPLAR